MCVIDIFNTICDRMLLEFFYPSGTVFILQYDEINLSLDLQDKMNGESIPIDSWLRACMLTIECLFISVGVVDWLTSVGEVTDMFICPAHQE